MPTVVLDIYVRLRTDKKSRKTLNKQVPCVFEHSNQWWLWFHGLKIRDKQ